MNTTIPLTAPQRLSKSKLTAERTRLFELVEAVSKTGIAMGRLGVLSYGMPASLDAAHKHKLAKEELRRALGEEKS